MSFFITTNVESVNHANHKKNTHKAENKIDWNSIWEDFNNGKNDNLDSWTNFYEQEMARLNELQNQTYSDLYSNGATRAKNNYKKYQVGADATTLDKAYDKSKGKLLAQYAQQTANEMTAERNGRNEFYCARGVRYTFEKAGIKKDKNESGHAYQYAQILEENPNFKEIVVSKEDLKKLPAGCVIVYNNKATGNGAGDIYGHVTITLGNGKEASDRICNITDKSNEFRVFVWS